MVGIEGSKGELFLMHPFVWGHVPVMMVDRDGVQMGALT